MQWAPTREGKAPFTCVLLHGILGSKRNLLSFARRLALENPAWQFLLVDLRNHGQSAATPAPGPHTVESAAQDVLSLLRELRLFPQCLVGHSFGGKVAMALMHNYSRRLPRPVAVWVLDTVPGDVFADGSDHPRDVIAFLSSLDVSLVRSRRELVSLLLDEGYSADTSSWMTTNLTFRADAPTRWLFNLAEIAEMYRSYEAISLWPLVEQPPEGGSIDFVRAERSAFRWSGADEQRIIDAGARVHFLPSSGHNVHIDNPAGLAALLSQTFQLAGASRLKETV